MNGHDYALIADVDCTADQSKPLCDREDILGFPALQYGDQFALENYDGPRSYQDLLVFATQVLKPICSPDNVDACDAEKKKMIQRYQSMSKEEIKEEIQKEKDKIKATRKSFDKQIERLSKEYERIMEEKSKKIAEVQSSSELKYLQAIERAKSKEADGEDAPAKGSVSQKDEL
jgi:hypothetical protein